MSGSSNRMLLLPAHAHLFGNCKLAMNTCILARPDPELELEMDILDIVVRVVESFNGSINSISVCDLCIRTLYYYLLR